MATEINGPFKRKDLKIVDGEGRAIASVRVSNRVPTSAIEATGDLLASSWQLRELLRHVLTCSGSPSDCDSCKEAADLIR